MLQQVDLHLPMLLGREKAVHVPQQLVSPHKLQQYRAVAFLVIGPDDMLGPTAEHRQGLDVLGEQLQELGAALRIGAVGAKRVQKRQLLGHASHRLQV